MTMTATDNHEPLTPIEAILTTRAIRRFTAEAVTFR